jgi:putative phosphoribosyl transferase
MIAPVIDPTPDGNGIAVSLPSEHGMLHGHLALLPEAPGIVVLAHAALALDNRDALMAGILRRAGLSTLSVDLLAKAEEHFPDVHNNAPLLAKRLLDFLGLLKNRMLLGELPMQPLGLCAANATSPVVVRVAAQRDHDIAAIVCRGGLIDLAGVLYLRSLESPLLMLVEETDVAHIASSRRALQEIACPTELKLIPEIGFDYAISAGFEMAGKEAAAWFLKHFNSARMTEI